VQVDVQLAAQQEVRAQEKSYTGYLVRDLVYAALRSVDPKYTERLHSERGPPAPFSVRPLTPSSGGGLGYSTRWCPPTPL